MRRVPSFRTGISKSSSEDRQAALTGFSGGLATAINGKLAPGGTLGDGTSTTGNENTRQTVVTFTKPGVPAFAVHDFGYTVYNWSIIDVKPGAQIGRSNRRPTKAGIWLEADLATVDAAGKFDPPVVAVVKMWGERGEEAST